jgi:hypothetical protein
MAGNPSQKKRQRELLQKEQRQEKAARRAERKAARDARDPTSTGEDPDLAGIVPGPQPRDEEM